MTEDRDQDTVLRVDLDDEPDLDLDQDTVMSAPGELLDLEAPPKASAPAPDTTRQTIPSKPPQHTPARSDPTPAPTLQGARSVTDATPPPAARRPKALTRTDVVPEFRRELRMTRVASGYDVCDPVTGQAHPLNEYEVSLARMLNGRRPVFEVLEAGERLGIPINLESLQKFIVLLEQYGFLCPPETLDAAVDSAVDNAWPSRGQWETSVRTLFQSGIRFLRMGKPAEAASYFEVLLQEEPDNVEARELLAMANQSLAAAAPQHVQFTNTPHAVTPLAFAPTPLSLPQQAPTQTMQMPTMQVAPQHPTVPVRRGVHWRYVLIGGGAVIVAVIAMLVGYLLRSADRDEPVIAKTDPTNLTKPDKLDPTKPELVADPTKPDPTKPDPTKPDLVAAPTKPDPTKPELVADPTKPDPTKPDPTKPDPTEPDPTKPEASEAPKDPKVTRVEAPSAGELRSFLRAPRKVRKGEKLFEIVRVDGDRVKIKQRQLDVEEMRLLAKQDPDYKAFLADARSELAKVMKVVVVTVKAPKDGKASPKAKPRTTVRSGEVLAEIE